MTFLSDSGKLYCLGILHENSKAQQQQKCQPHYYTEPKRISEHFVTRIAKCGSTFVVFVTGSFVFAISIFIRSNQTQKKGPKYIEINSFIFNH